MLVSASRRNNLLEKVEKLHGVPRVQKTSRSRDALARSPRRPLPLLECAQIVGHIWIFRCERFDIADFDVDFLYAGPFCARAEEPAPLSYHACSVERIARDQKLYALTCAEIRTDYGAFARAVFVQHKNFNRITQVAVIKLIVVNAMKAHRSIRRYHEIQGGARRPAIKKWCWEPARRNSLIADKRDAHESARGVRL